MKTRVNQECGAMLAGISGYLDGVLGATECEAIERHCRDCASCAALVHGLRETVGLCRDAGCATLPEAVRERARASIARLLAGEDPARS